MEGRDGERQGLPMPVGADPLFLAKTNKLVRAIDLARGQQLPFREALRLVEEGDQKRFEADVWDAPMPSRDTVARPAVQERRAGQDRRKASRRASDPFTLLGRLIFKLAASRLTIFLIIFALALKLMWPLFFKAPPPP
jgi:hypothetical protein